jgi:uncharacterized repeat protein (TIGR04138 family)
MSFERYTTKITVLAKERIILSEKPWTTLLKPWKKKSKAKAVMFLEMNLLEGIREYALERFGPMTLTLMDHWNIRKCRDFGEIVFNLVEHGILGRTENDSLGRF